jgi:hypothetical protein
LLARKLYEDEKRSSALLKEDIAAMQHGLAKLKDETKVLQSAPATRPMGSSKPPGRTALSREFSPLVKKHPI